MTNAVLHDIYQKAMLLPRHRLEAEAEVQTTKWFDYRFIPAVQATRIFAEEYTTVYREKWATYQDRSTAELKQPLRQWEHDRRVVNSLWMARLAADALGVPYRVFIQAAIDSAAGRGCSKFPRPNQLYHEFNLPRIQARWEELRSTRLYFSDHDVYRNVNFASLPEQIQHREWVIQEIRSRGSDPSAVEYAVYDREILFEHEAKQAFGEALMERIRRPESVATQNGSVRFKRSCFAFPHQTAANSRCASCSHEADCSKCASTIEMLIIKKFGSNDAHKSREQKKTRERVRRHRAKKRLMARSPLGDAAVFHQVG